MHAWGLRLRSACGALARYRAPQYCLPVRLTPSAPLILAISELTNSGYPAYMCPCPTLQVRGCPTALAWLGARMDSLLLSCMTLSFTTSRRFIPTLSRRKRLPHRAASPWSARWGRRFRLPSRGCSRFFHSLSRSRLSIRFRAARVRSCERIGCSPGWADGTVCPTVPAKDLQPGGAGAFAWIASG